MSRSLTPDELEKWKEIARKFRGTQQKLLKKRKAYESLLEETQRAVAELGDRQGPGADFLRAQLRVVELGMRQMRAFDLDSNVYNPPTEADTPAYEARQLELQLAMVEQLLVAHVALAGIVGPDLPRVTQGEPAPRGLPEAWLAERAQLGDTERHGLWERFVEATQAFERERAALEAAPTPGPSPERLVWLRKVVPGLRGAQYRITGALRLLPTGEAVLKSVREQLVAELRLTGKVAAPKRSGNAMTDRLRDMFRPPGK